MNSRDRIKTSIALGFKNLIRVGGYRFGLKMGIHPVLKISENITKGPFFTFNTNKALKNVIPREAWSNQMEYFGAHYFKLETPYPNWHSNPFKKDATIPPLQDWFKIPDFNDIVGDIKTVWEPSRFDLSLIHI